MWMWRGEVEGAIHIECSNGRTDEISTPRCRKHPERKFLIEN